MIQAIRVPGQILENQLSVQQRDQVGQYTLVYGFSRELSIADIILNA